MFNLLSSTVPLRSLITRFLTAHHSSFRTPFAGSAKHYRRLSLLCNSPLRQAAGNPLAALRNFCSNKNHVPGADSVIDETTTTALQSSFMGESSYPRFTVFISHAGEDKATIAFPLREKLREQGITAFVDEADIPRGTDAIRAMIEVMETARVAVIVLSPEFVAREWPMKEMMCFLRRRENSGADGRDPPVIIPFFYRLKISELFDEPRLDRTDKNGKHLYRESRFYERRERGDPEASIAGIKAALQTVRRIMGVRNDLDASNDSDYKMNRKREILLQELCDRVREAVPTGTVKTTTKERNRMSDRDTFRAEFDEPYDTSELFLDFDSKHEDGTARTQEGRLLEILLDRSQDVNKSIAIRGKAGVGKTSLLRRIRSLKKRVKQRFRDGIYDITLGVYATHGELIDALSRAVQSSGGEKAADAMRTETDVRKVMNQFRGWFAKKQCLFVVDDVWETKELPSKTIQELMKLQVSGQGSRVLLATRNMTIASWADESFGLEPRGTLDDESRAILYGYAGIEPEPYQEDCKKSVDEILGMCKGLPLVLAIAGKAVKALSFRRGPARTVAYHIYAESLKESMEKLYTTNVGPLYEALSERLSISVELLEKRKEYFGFRTAVTIAEMHRRLSVVTIHTRLPMSMLTHLWELESESQAATVAREFEQVGLADVEHERRGTRYVELLRLHDSIYEFARNEARKHTEGRSGHEALLRGYGRDLPVTKGCREWWRTCLETDGYVHANICRHLLAARRSAELIRLLLSPQWTERQLNVNGYIFLEADFSRAIRALQAKNVDDIHEDRVEVEQALRLISEATVLAWPFVIRNFGELWFQVHGRLLGHGRSLRTIREFLDRIEEEETGLPVRSVNRFLREPSGVNRKVVPVGVPVLCMALLKDGERAICGSRDGRIFIVDLLRSEIKDKWKAHDSRITAIAVRDGGATTRIVSASGATVKVWSIDTGHCIATFNDHTRAVNGVEVTEDGKRTVSVSDDGTARIWKTDTAEVVTTPFEGHKASIRCAAVVGDGEHVLTGGEDQKLRLWSATTGAQVHDPFDGHEDWVTCVAVSPNRRRVVSGSWDTSLRVWDLETHQQVGNPWQGHTRGIESVSVSKDGSRIVSGSWDNTIRVWDSDCGTEICAALEGHTETVTGVSFLADTDSVVSSSEDGTLRVWNVRRQKTKKITHRHGTPVSSVSFTPNGRLVVSGSYDGTLRIWNTTSGEQVGLPIHAHSRGVTDVAVTPDGRCVLSVSDDKSLRVWDLGTRQLLHTFNGHTDWINCVALNPHGDRAVTGSDDRTLRIWDLAAMDGSHAVLDEHSASVRRVFVSDDGSRILSVDRQGNIFVWDFETKSVIKRVTHEEAWSLSRRQVLDLVGETTLRDNTTLSIPLWGHEVLDSEGADARVLATLESDVWSWALSPDQKTICTGLWDGQVVFMKLKR